MCVRVCVCEQDGGGCRGWLNVGFESDSDIISTISFSVTAEC